MTDRELLELAAKAAGSDVFMLGGTWVQKIGKEIDGLERWVGRWNPLEDDGDALRLAVKLRLNVILDASPTYHYAENDEYESLDEMNGCCTKASECDDDPYAAARRAITRAAAEIGKAMP